MALAVLATAMRAHVPQDEDSAWESHPHFSTWLVSRFPECAVASYTVTRAADATAHPDADGARFAWPHRGESVATATATVTEMLETSDEPLVIEQVRTHLVDLRQSPRRSRAGQPTQFSLVLRILSSLDPALAVETTHRNRIWDTRRHVLEVRSE